MSRRDETQPSGGSSRSPSEQLAAFERNGGTLQELLVFFDSLPPVEIEALFGRWKGAEILTGHPLEGLLERYGWYGKEFVDAETVHPLLFQGAGGTIFQVDPRKVPMGLAPRMPRLGGGTTCFVGSTATRSSA